MIQRPNLLVLCMKKGASTFVADVLLPSIALRTGDYDLCNVGSLLILYRQKLQAETGSLPKWADAPVEEQLKIYFPQHPLPRSNALIGRIYPHYWPALEQSLGERLPSANHRLVVVRRDPRDALVSLYYSLAVSHSDTQILSSPLRYREIRRQLLAESPCEGIKSLMRNPRTDWIVPQFLGCTQKLLDHPEACDLPYEMLINQPRQWLTRFVEFGQLHSYVDESWYAEMIEHLQPPEVEDQTKHKRRMRPGNWVDVFDDQLRDRVEELVGDRMRQFGYSWETRSSSVKGNVAA
jgi:hypothetical protein